MGILVDSKTRVLVQGITGKQGSFHTNLMRHYGTRIVAGVSPGKGGTQLDGVPVYDTVHDAQLDHVADASVIFVPALFAADAALEALAGSIQLVVIVTEHVPIKDAIAVMSYAAQRNAMVVGPNTPALSHPEMQGWDYAFQRVFRRQRGHSFQKRYFNLRNRSRLDPRWSGAVYLCGSRRRPSDRLKLH